MTVVHLSRLYGDCKINEMARSNLKLKDLDVDELFRENTIEEIIQVQKRIDVEIERKRSELRSMVGDRYKDILTASDAIHSMKSISENIVSNIDELSSHCQLLIEEAQSIEEKPQTIVKPEQIEERTIVMQIQLTMLLNQQIWSAINTHDFSKAAQFYLLAQHIHTGLRLLRRDMIERLPILKDIKSTLDELRNKLLVTNRAKLQMVNLTPQEASDNLITMILLQTDNSLDLLNQLMDLRKSALLSIIERQHESVRTQVSAMVRSLVTTVHLIHDCFLCYETTSRGLLWQKLDDIVLDDSPSTLSQLVVPKSPLCAYIPDIIANVRPKCKTGFNNISTNDLHKVMEDWLRDTTVTVSGGLKKHLDTVVHMKGLHVVRQEALKLGLPSDWEKICVQTNLPNTFNVWRYFFQSLVTDRAHALVSHKIETILIDVRQSIEAELRNWTNHDYNETDLRRYMWSESIGDMVKTETEQSGLSMKTKGYSPRIVALCKKLNDTYLDFWRDVHHYFFGKEYDASRSCHLIYGLNDRVDRNQDDRERLAVHLRTQCLRFSEKLIAFLHEAVQSESDAKLKLLKSIACARFVQAIPILCPHYQKCCTFNGNTNDREWERIGNALTESGLQFWQTWLDDSINDTTNRAKSLSDVASVGHILTILPKWDVIEIEEQTDDKVFVSQIRVPSQTTPVLHAALARLCERLSAVLPHTLPKAIHLRYIERNVRLLLDGYEEATTKTLADGPNQNVSLQFLFDVKFLTAFCVPKENVDLMRRSQSICDRLRAGIDPFDLDVFYAHVQTNVKRCVYRSQVIFGCLLPATAQLASLGTCEWKRDEKDPTAMALSVPSTTSWFPLLPVTAPSQKTTAPSQQQQQKDNKVPTLVKTPSAKKLDAAGTIRSGAASLFGAMATDWFS